MANKLNEINTSRVLQKLWFSRGISRVEIARELGLGKSTVTKIVQSCHWRYSRDGTRPCFWAFT